MSGRLDNAGRRRLDELCAARPDLADRYRKEQRLSGLLSRCGPNYAPPDLARCVMARLETRRTRPARPWFAWVFQPAMRTALAAMVLVAVGVEAGLLIGDWRNRPAEKSIDGPFIPAELQATAEILPAVPATNAPATSRVPDARKPGRGPVKSIGPARTRSTPPPASTPYRTEEFGSLASNTTNIFPPNQPSGSPAVFPSILNPPLVPETAIQPQATPAARRQNPAVPSMVASKTGAATPAEAGDHEVAMNISLNSTLLVPLASTATPPQAIPFSGTAFVLPGTKTRPQALSHKEIEYTITAVNGDLIESKLMPGRPNTWQVRARMTPAQFRTYAMNLRNYGIRAEPATLADTEKQADILRQQSPVSAGNVFKITHGSHWLKPPVINLTQPAGGSATSSTTRSPQGNAARAISTPEKLDITIVVEQYGKR